VPITETLSGGPSGVLTRGPNREPGAKAFVWYARTKELGVTGPGAAEVMATDSAASQTVVFTLEIGKPVLDAPILVDEQLARCGISCYDVHWIRDRFMK
jgi:hypothetical protein